ncbi:MAG TPA: Hsp20/alpha crystallin family protein [Candidatus Aquilonibacter sp.]|nr:Hsp20/alpha crystallin family protein [Candidatus Aquilonibacter sp.]
MSHLARRESFFPELFGFRRDFDDLFNRLLGEGSPGIERAGTLTSPVMLEVPPVESWVDRERNTFHARVALPGVDAQNVQVSAESGALSISAERKETRENKDVNYLRREFSYGRIERMLTLPEGVDRDKISAEYNNGVLEISAPISTAAMPRRIEVKTGQKTKGASA